MVERDAGTHQSTLLPAPRVDVLRPDTPFFDKSTKEFLVRNGYVFYLLNGSTIREKRDQEGLRTVTTWHYSLPDVEDVQGYVGEIGFHSTLPFLSASGLRPVEDHEGMIERFGQEINGQLPDVLAMQGSVTDLTALSHIHQITTGRRLFKPEPGFGYASTSSSIGEANIPIFVGDHSAIGGLSIRAGEYMPTNSTTWAMPLLIPKLLRQSGVY